MAASLVFHLLDIHSRDQRVEEETEEFKKVAFETGLDDSDDDEIRNTRKRKAGSKSNKGRREFIIHLFGETAEGKPVQVDVVGFRPAFYLLLPSERVSEAIDVIKSYLAGNKIPIDDVVMKRETHESFMGFSARTKYNFLYLDFPSLSMWREARSLFLSDKLVPAVRRPLGPPFQKAPDVFEANIDPMLRFLHVQNLAPCGWIEIEDGIDSSDDIDGTITLTCDFECVEPCAKPPRPTAPFLIASWDIECYSETGDFPIAKKGERKRGDPVIQIGVSLTRDCRSFERHLFVWPSCDPCDGITVHSSADEKTMIADFCRWFTLQNPDIILGYNIFGFDEKYLWERAEELRCVGSFQGLNRTGAEVKLDEKMLSSSAMGDNYLYTWSTQGRLQIDLYHYIKRGTQLPSYKLDEVTKNYMSGKLKGYRIGEGDDSSKLFLDVAGAVKDIRPGRAICLLDAIGESITDKLVVLEVAGATLTVACPSDPDTVKCLEDAQKWVVVKDDVSPQDIFRLHRGTAADRAAVGRYCIQDCDLVLELYKKLEVFNNAMSMANVCSVPINYIFMRGQGVKAESLIFKACRQRGVLIPVLPAPRQHGDSGPPEDSYEGAIVLDPEPGFYHRSPIGVADFASLYPSTIESENISHDSLVWVKDYTYDGTFITCSFGSDKYAECEGYGYTDIEFDIWRPDPDDKRKHPVKVKMGRRVCRYAQPLDGSKSTLPEIIRSLLAARKAKRKEAAVEKDAERAALLDAEQLAYKLTANSLYGQLGSGTFKVRLQNLAASVTAYGRKQIMFAKAVIERFYSGEADKRCDATCDAKVVYGDSVTGDTALPIRINGIVQTRRIDELGGASSKWMTWHDTKECIELDGVMVWTEGGFTQVNRIIRHKLAPHKKLYRICTHTGVVDATEDHSLVLSDGTETRPCDVQVGTELLHNYHIHGAITVANTDGITVNEAFVMGFFVADGSSDVYNCPSGMKASWAINKADLDLLERTQALCPFPTKILDTLESSGVYKLVPVGKIVEQAKRYRELFYNSHREKRIPNEILNAPLDIVQSFWDGFYAGDGDKDVNGYVRFDQKGKEIGTGMYILARRLGYSVSITERESKENIFRYTMTKKNQRKNPIAIKKIRELPHPGPAAYVYDLETENHHFAVGPGALIVHNTDSLFVEFNPRDESTGERLTGREARQAVIDLTAEAGQLVTKALKPPHDFEFDKVFDPMLIFSKKRYAGLMFENNADEFVHKYMGIALKRRDNAPIVKTIFGGAMKKLLIERDVPGATMLVKQLCTELVEGKSSINQLTITKSLRAEYADPSRIAHKALADRIAVRDPGNAPASGDRIGFVYIRPKAGQEAAKLQGERIETPAYVREHGLLPDYRFYIEHQIQNPVAQMFGIVLEDMPGFDCRILADCPVDRDKRISWREIKAGELLFNRALNKCTTSDTKQFVKTFFGGATTKPVNVIVNGPERATTKTVAKKPIQSSISSYLTDRAICEMIPKKPKRSKPNE